MFKWQMMLLLYKFIVVLLIFIGVVFVTLLERKVLGLIQFRLGPNKVFLKGEVQSFSDALKLLVKGYMKFFFSSFVEYNFLPLGMMVVMMTLWTMFPNMMYDYSSNMLLLLCILSVGIYPVMFGSWFSGSFYSMYGSIRSVAQMISYEVSMIILIMNLLVFSKSFNLLDFWGWANVMVFMFIFVLGVVLMSSFLVELGRTPVDLLEGESELVSGFNTEYSGFKFALVFLSEYGMIMFMSGLFSSMFTGVEVFSMLWIVMVMLMLLLIIWVRGVLPRIRYDKLMKMCWVSILSISVSLFTLNIGVIMVL